MKLFKYLIVLSLMLSLSVFVVGCGVDIETSESDPVMSGRSDPALDESTTDTSGGGDDANSDDANSDDAN